MKILSSSRRQPIICVCLVFIIILTWILPSYANAGSRPKEGSPAFVRIAREIETAELGIPHPAGLAYSPANNALQVVNAIPTDQPIPASIDLATITLSEESADSTTIQTSNSDPINMAFDGAKGRLLILKPDGQEIVEVPAGLNGKVKSAMSSSHNTGYWKLKKPKGIAVDPVSGQIFILDLSGPRLLSIMPATSGVLEEAVVTETDLASLNLAGPQGLAFDPKTGHLFILSRSEQTLYELTQSGQVVNTRDLSSFGLRDPQAMVIAPSGDLTDDPAQQSLYLADSGLTNKLRISAASVQGAASPSGQILELSFVEPAALPAFSYTSTLLHTIDTSKFSKPSPDPDGLDIISSNTLLIGDSEVDEMPAIWGVTHVNLFKTTLSGSLIETASTISFTNEPTGIARNPANQHLFFSDDNHKKIFERYSDADGLPTTAVTSFSTSTFGSNDPEDVVYVASLGSLFIIDGTNAEVYQVQPGANGRFDGVSPDGDDQVASFDTASLGILDPEGIDFNSTTGHLYVVGKPATAMAELTSAGTLVQMIDISAAAALKPAALKIGPSSGNPAVKVIYIADRGVDNNKDPNENDGKVYEISLPSDTPNTAPTVTISSPSNNATYTAGTAISFSGSALDTPDGNLSANLSWTSSIDGPIGNGASFSKANLSVGTHTITAAVTDSGGLSGSAQISITISNTAPVVTITGPTNGTSVAAGTAISFSGSALDTPDGNLSAGLSWTSSKDGVIGNGASFSKANLSVGTHTITAAVTDSGGLSGSAQISITISNTAPVVTITGPTNGTSAAAGTAISFSGSALDTPDGNLSAGLSWTSSLDGPIGNGASFSKANLSVGTHTITAAVTDSGGLSGSAQISITISNTAPVVTITGPTNGTSAAAGTAISFSGSALDTPDGNLSAGLSWTSSLDGPIGNGASFSKANLSVGTHTITAAVTDSGGLSGSAQVTITVTKIPNTAPAVTITGPIDGASSVVGTSISFSGSATDTQDGNLSAGLSWTSSKDGVIGSGAGFSTSSLSLGMHTITAAVTDSGGLSGSAQVTITVTEIPNTAPAVTITSPTDGASSVMGTSISFSGSALDTTDGDLSAGLSWTSSLDGPIGNGTSFSKANLSVGTHTITAAVTDSGGLSGSAQVTITVTEIPNTAPAVTITGPTEGTSYTVGTSISFSGSATDTQDGNLSAGLSWTSSKDGVIGNGAGFSTSSLSLGTHTITAAVTDNRGLSGSAQVTITVTEIPNTAPTVTITGPAEGTSYTVGTSISFSGSATDTQDGNLSAGLSWTSSLDGPIGNGASFSKANLSVGTHTITAAVTDSGGLSGSAQVTITVTEIPNTAPAVTITAPIDGASSVVGTNISFSGSATDTQDGNLSAGLSWTSSLNGPIGSGTSFSKANLSVGTHTITAAVTDNGGLPGSAQVTITVAEIPNTAPAVTITGPIDGASSTVGTSISFSGSAIDTQDGNLSAGLSWTSSKDGVIGNGAGFSTSSLSLGTHTITAAVTDNGGLSGSAQVIVIVTEIPNTAPVVTITGPAEGTSYTVGTSISFSGSAIDTQDGDLSAGLSWTSSKDGVIGNGASFSKANLSVGTHTITAAVTDNGGLSGSAQVIITVTGIPNTAPVVTITGPIDGASSVVGTSISFSGSATDTQDGNLSAGLSWTSSKDGVIGTGAGFSTSSLSIGTHTITAAVTDNGGLSGSAQVTVTVTEIPNTAPVVTITGPAEGTSYTTGTSISFSGSAIDTQDGDLSAGLSWTSSLDGPIGNGASFSKANLSVGTHTITAVVTDNGGLSGSAQVTITVTEIPNTAPVVTITGPIDGASSVVGTSISFSGSALDTQDGNLSAGLSWTSSLDGPIGNGASFSKANLSVGTHTITAVVTDNGGLSGSAQVTITVTEIPNTAPVVTITGPIDGASSVVGTSISFSGSAIDTQDGDLSAGLSWTSSKDGVIGTGAGFSTSSLSLGTHTITAAVTDNGGLSGSAQVTITVTEIPNTAPVVTITGPAEGTSYTTGTSISFSGSAIDTQDGNLSAGLSWTSSKDGVIGSGASFSKANLSVGTHTITAAVTDNGGLSGSAQVTITVTEIPNTAPVVTITGPVEGASYTAGTAISFSGSAIDTQDGDLSAGLSWTSSKDGVVGNGAGFSTSSLSIGTHTITASVTDNGGLSGSAQVTVTVTEIPNTAPVVAIAGPAEGASYIVGTSISFSGSATDTQDGNLSAGLSWTSSLDGPIGNGASFSKANLSVGTHTITAAVTDNGGLSGSAQVTVTVTEIPNTAPVVTITSPSEGASYTTGTSISFSGSASDAQDGSLTAGLTWTSSKDGVVGNGAGFSTSSLSIGTHTITAAVTDSGGLSGSAQVTVTVTEIPNTAPVVAITSPTDGASAVVGTSISFSGSAIDTQDGDLSAGLSWTSSKDGVVGNGAGFSTSSLSIGTHTITASVTDNGGLSGSAQVTVTVTEIPNTAPVVAIAGPAEGASYIVGTSISFSGSATDTQDGNLSAGLSWTSSKDGVVGSGAGFSTSSLSLGTHTITAAVTDNGGLPGSAQVTITVTEIPNTAPVVTITGPSEGASYTTGTSISFSGSASDAQDGSLTAGLTWTSSKDGVVGNGAGFSTSSLSIGTHTITAAVTDSGGLSGSAQVTVTVTEIPNTAPVVAITSPTDGASAVVGTSISFSGSATDTQDGNLSAGLSWTSSKDGVVGSGAGFSTSSLSIGTHTITASVTDNGGLSGSAQVTVTVTEIPNTAPVVAITSPAEGASNIVGTSISFSGSATDTQDGNLSAGLSWTSSKDGVIGNGAGFSTSSLSIGTHMITAAVTDNGGLSGSAQVTVTVTEIPNTAPVVAITSPTDGASAVVGTSISFSGSATDTQDGNLSAGLSWTSSLDGPIGNGVGFSTSSLSLGTHTITAAVTDNGGLSGSAQVTITVTEIPNTAPVVTITGPSEGASYTTGTSISFSGSASDAQDGSLTAGLSWTSSLDGPIGNGASFSKANLSVGTHTITAAVTDSGGLSGSAQVTITITEIPNTAPAVTITGPTDGASSTVGTSISFSGSATDTQDGNLSAGLSWTSSKDGVIGNGAGFSTSSLSLGTHTITAAVTDNGGLSGSAQVTITVTGIPNTAPAVTITGPTDGASSVVGTSISFSGSALDTTDGDLSAGLSWTSSKDGVIGSGAGFSTSSLSLGTHTITAAVTDNGGLSGSAQVTITVTEIPNTAPAVTITSPIDGASSVVGTSISFSGSATDTQDGDLSAGLSWTSSKDGVIGNGAGFSTSSLSLGTHTITAAVTDNGGLSGSAQVIVTVTEIPNTAPVVTITSPAEGTSYIVGTSISFSGSATDTQEGNLSAGLIWTSSKDGVIGSGAGFSTSSLSLGTHTITAAVTDNGGLSGSAQVTVTVTEISNTAPAVTITGPTDGASYTVGTAISFSGSATDTQDGDLSAGLSWTSSKDGVIGNGASFSKANLSVGTHTITAAVTDNGGLPGSAQVTIEVTEIPNTAPVVTITSPIDGASFVMGTSISFSGNASDTQDGNLSAGLSWTSSKDGVIGNGASFSKANLSVGTHTITAAVTDNGGLPGSAQVTITVTEIPNTAPAVTITSPAEGASYIVGTAISFSGSATDTQDGDLSAGLSWTSSKDGVIGNGASFSKANLSVGTHTITAAVTDNGGLPGSAQVTITVTEIPNTAPAVTITSPAEGTSYTVGTNISFSGSALDTQDGNLSAGLSWTSSKDGVIGNGAGFSTSSLSLGTHTITAAVTDNGGLSGSAQVTIEVTEIPNTAPAVTITSPAEGTSYTVGTNISFSGSALDTQDGNLSAGLSWTSSLDGPIGNGASFSKANLSVGTHTITAAVTDNGGLSGSAQVTVTVTEIPNTAPVVTITSPTDGASSSVGTSISFSGSATDTQDGNLSAGLSWTSSKDGVIGNGAGFSTSSLSIGTHTITAAVTDNGGLSGSAQVTVTVTPLQSGYTFSPSADAKVVSSSPSANYGTTTYLEERVSTDTRRGYLKFDVTGLSGTVKSAKIRVYALRTFSGGDSAYLISNNYQGTTNPWTESGLNWNNAPSLPGTYLSKVAPVTANTWVEFDVTAAVTGNGVYSFALAHSATTLTSYNTKEAAQNRPVLVIETQTSANTPPNVNLSSPVNNAIYATGTAISFSGSASDAQDGSLTAGLTWSSSLDGPIGNGASFSKANLSVGTHTITAAVTDNGGLSGSAQVTVTVTSDNTAPTVIITSPTNGASYSAGTAISFSGSASDAQDGSLTAGLTWSSSLDGPIGNGASFSKANLSVGTHTITAAVTDNGGLSGSAQVTVTVTPLQSGYTFSPSADAKVVSSAPSTNYGTTTYLEERVSTDTRRGYLKFDVTGLSGTVKSAKIRVYALRTFSGGDSAYLVSNNYQGTTNPWTESGLNWNNAPSLPGTYLSKVAPVTANTWVEFDVTAAVTGNGVYSFALAHNATTLTSYNTKEAAQNQPVLVIETL